MIFIERWWCCLNSIERNLIVLVLPNFLAFGSYIKLDNFNLYWLANGYLPDNPRVQHAIYVFSLVPGTVTDEEGNPLDVLFLDPVWWGQAYAFAQTDAFICTQQCKILRFSNSFV